MESLKLIVTKLGYDFEQVSKMVDQYGLPLVVLFFRLLELYQATPKKAHAHKEDCCAELAEALCDAECKALAALVAAHHARHVAGCCEH